MDQGFDELREELDAAIEGLQPLTGYGEDAVWRPANRAWKALVKARDALSAPTGFNEEDCLAYDPFAGDDYGGGFVDMGKKIVNGRGEYECHICCGPIAKGERHRVDSCILDGERHHARFCGLCCAAMAKSWEDGGEAITDRERMFPVGEK